MTRFQHGTRVRDRHSHKGLPRYVPKSAKVCTESGRPHVEDSRVQPTHAFVSCGNTVIRVVSATAISKRRTHHTPHHTTPHHNPPHHSGLVVDHEPGVRVLPVFVWNMAGAHDALLFEGGAQAVAYPGMVLAVRPLRVRHAPAATRICMRVFGVVKPVCSLGWIDSGGGFVFPCLLCAGWAGG
jgi:hypothetical protein